MMNQKIDPMLPALWRVRRARRDTRDTFTLDLEPANAGEGFQFLPGQFNMLYVFGAGEVPISMSGDPAKSGVMTHTHVPVVSPTIAGLPMSMPRCSNSRW